MKFKKLKVKLPSGKKIAMVLSVLALVIVVMLVYSWRADYEKQSVTLKQQRMELISPGVPSGGQSSGEEQQQVLIEQTDVEDILQKAETASARVVELQDTHVDVMRRIGSASGEEETALFNAFQSARDEMRMYFGSGSISECWYTWSSETYPDVKWNYYVMQDYEGLQVPVTWLCEDKDGTILACVNAKYDNSVEKFVDYELFLTVPGAQYTAYSNDSGTEDAPDTDVDVSQFLKDIEKIVGGDLQIVPDTTETP